MTRIAYDRTARSSRNYDAQVDQGTDRRSFGVPDQMGRTIGGLAYKFVAVYDPAAEDASYYHCHPVGTFYGYRPHATRNGKPYGALQREQTFTSEAERDAAVETYFRNAAKRAAKR